MKKKPTEVEFSEAPFEIIDGDRGKNYPKQSDFQHSGHCLFLSATNVTKYGFEFSDCLFIDEKKDTELSKGKLHREDIVLTTRGTIGNTAHYNRSVPFENIRINSGMVILRCDENKISPAYLYHFVRSPSFYSQINTLRSGSAQPQLPIRDMLRIKLPFPELSVQQKVAKILSVYDDLIENSRRRIKILEEIARALYRDWFVEFRFPGHESFSLVPSPLGEIPKGWEAMKLGDICELRKDPYRETDHSALPLMDMARMPSRSLATGDTGSPAELTTSRILFQSGDTLFGAIRCYLHKVVAAHYPGVTNTSVLVLRPRSPSFRALVAIIASDIDTIRWAETQSTGTKMPVINWGVFQGMRSPIPSKAVAQAFEDIAGPMLDKIGVLATQIQILRRTRDLLLPRLLSGDLALEA